MSVSLVSDLDADIEQRLGAQPLGALLSSCPSVASFLASVDLSVRDTSQPLRLWLDELPEAIEAVVVGNEVIYRGEQKVEDLIEMIKAPKVDPATPLPWAVEDPRVVKFTRHIDLGWLRILDVKKAMAVRGWDHQGSVTFHVVDPMGYAEGTWRVDVEAPGAPATVTKVDDSTDAATLDVAALGSLYFGMGRGFSLAAAHRITGTDEQIAAVDRMFSTVDVAHNISEF